MQLAEFWNSMMLGRKSLVTSDIEEQIEIENVRLNNFCDALLSETIAYAELDVENAQILKAGGIWNEDMTLPEKIVSSLEDTEWKETIDKERFTKRFMVEHEINGEMRQIELMIHIFKEQYSGQRYALLYQVRI